MCVNIICVLEVFFANHRGQESNHLLDQARCMAQLAHAYHLQHDNIRTLMVVMKQLNAVEEAQEDIHEASVCGCPPAEIIPSEQVVAPACPVWV